MKFRLLFLLLIASISSLIAQDWEQQFSKEGVSVWTRKISWSDYKEFKGETTVNGSLNEILSILDDINCYTKWVYNCIEAKQIKRESAFRGIRYTAIKAPWPVTDRDVVFEYTVSQNRTTKVVNIKLIGIKGVVPEKGRVRMTYMIGNYQLTPIGKNKTKVIFQSHNDPAGSVPTSIVNKMITDTPYNTLLNLKTLIKSGNYRKQVFNEIIEF